MSNWRRHRAFHWRKSTRKWPVSGSVFEGRGSKTDPETGHFRVLFRQWPVSGSVFEGRGASGPAQGQITHTNHTPMNYKYCLVGACQSMTSPLQPKLSPRSAARQGWVCLPDIHCSRCPRSWSAAGSPNLCTNLKLRLHQLDNICSSHS